MMEGPLHILQVMECTIGGTRRHLKELACGLALRGHRVTAVCSAERDPSFREDMAEMARLGVQVQELPMVRPISPVADLRHLMALRRVMQAHPFHVVHTHSSKAGVLGRLAALSLGIRTLVHTPHTFAFSFERGFGSGKKAFFLRVERFLGRRTAALVNVSPSEREEALRFRVVPPERARVVPNGIDPWPYRWAEPPGVKDRLFPGEGPGPRIATVGLMNEAKGHAVLLRAFARVHPRHPEARLAVVGTGPLEARLRELAFELGIGDRVVFPGYREDVPALLKELDLFVLPSLWEGLPYVLLEAMAAGVPVVATDVNGSRDVVRNGETGLLAPPGDEEALAGAVLRLLDRPAEGEALAQRALRALFAGYTLDRMLDRMEAVYREVAERGLHPEQGGGRPR